MNPRPGPVMSLLSGDNRDFCPPATDQDSMLPPPSPLHRMPANQQPPTPASAPPATAGSPPATGESPPDPVLNFVGDMMSLMSRFAASYQSSIGQVPANQGPLMQPVIPHHSSQQEVPHPASQHEIQASKNDDTSAAINGGTPASQNVEPNPAVRPASNSEQQKLQGKKPRLYSPEVQANQPDGTSSSNQPSGTNRSTIQPTDEWLGDTQEDLAQQLDQLDQYSNNVSITTEYEDRMSSPFPHSNNSEKSEPLFTVPRQAWITHQISSHLNDLSDELFVRLNKADAKLEEVEAKLNNTEENLESANKLIASQTNKIIQHETRISDLITAKDKQTKEINNLKQEITTIRKQPVQHPATRQKGPQETSLGPLSQTSDSNLLEAVQPPTSHTPSSTLKTSDQNNGGIETPASRKQPSGNNKPIQNTNQQEECPPLPMPAQPSQWADSWNATSRRPVHPVKTTDRNKPEKSARQIKIEQIIYDGNRTLGFKPMSRRRIQQFMSQPEIAHLPPKEKEEAAKRLAVKDFLKDEMLFTDEEIANLTIEKTFFPRNNDAKILYVRFADPKQRAAVTSKSNLLQPNEEHPSMTPKLIKYIPTEIFNRFKALETYAYQLRNNESNPLSTNIRFGTDDLELRVRPAKNNSKYDEDARPDPWQYIPPTPLPDLPAIDLNRDKNLTVRPPGRRLVPSPPPSPIPVPEEFIAIDDQELQPLGRNPSSDHSNQSEQPNEAGDKKKRRLSTSSDNHDSIFTKPLPVRHTTFPPALNMERHLQSQSSSSTSPIPAQAAPSAPASIDQSCQ